ncbi:MAG: hypothetical protein KKD38_05145 [Candidatus Delongbacteria bacterium]|nr:hypothetical protein [Candidatus Delongbacteria bacterium]MCG2759623.1 hypothetical protein [Candidatus Delongbacteria bacterium]
MKTIEYKFMFKDGREKIFKFQWDNDKFELVGIKPTTRLPIWTDLDFNKCPNCPLDSEKIKSCPMAVALVDLVKYFDGMKSFEKVYLEVEMDGKKISQETTVQKALSVMMGLVSAVSGCPHTSFFKPMAYFHLPFADKENTIYRATSMYLLAQYFLAKDGKDFDKELKGLNKIYKNMTIVNTSVAERLREASRTDSSINAIVTLDIYAKTVPIHIDSSLSTLKNLFDSYFIYDISD